MQTRHLEQRLDRIAGSNKLRYIMTFDKHPDGNFADPDGRVFTPGEMRKKGLVALFTAENLVGV